MPTLTQSGFEESPSQRWALLLCRLSTFFAVQGATVLVLYALMGPQTTPEDLPILLQKDPLHGAIHLVWGLTGAYVGFWRPSFAVRYTQIFAIFFLLLAVLGTFTSVHLGMQLELPENGLHWALFLIAGVIGFGPPLVSAVQRG